MKDQIISFETAKLAKEKGFRIPTLYHFEQNHNAGIPFIEVIDEVFPNQIGESQLGYILQPIEWNGGGWVLDKISAPTQSLLQRWLREIHYIDVESRTIRYAGDDKSSGYSSY